MAVPSHWHRVGRKSTTENDKLTCSDHLQCSYISEYSILHIVACEASWRGGYGQTVWIEQSWVRCSVAAVWRGVRGQGTSLVSALSRPWSEWVPGWTVIACVFE